MPSYPIYRGMAAMFLVVIFYSVNDALIKWLAATYHPLQVMFCRSCFLCLPLLSGAFQKKSWESLKSLKVGFQALRAGITALSVMLYVYAFSQLPLADAYAIAYVAPFFMALFSKPLLGEKVEKHGWIAIIIGFMGVLFMIQPGSTVFSLGGLSSFIAAVLYALALVMSRKLSQTESDFSIAIWFCGACLLMSGLFMPFYWKTPTLSDWGLFAALGSIGGAAIMAITRAFSLAPVFIVGPLDYLTIIFGTLLGYIIWGDIPDSFVIGGASLLILGGLYLVYQEARRRPFVLAPVLPE